MECQLQQVAEGGPGEEAFIWGAGGDGSTDGVRRAVCEEIVQGDGGVGWHIRGVVLGAARGVASVQGAALQRADGGTLPSGL